MTKLCFLLFAAVIGSADCFAADPPPAGSSNNQARVNPTALPPSAAKPEVRPSSVIASQPSPPSIAAPKAIPNDSAPSASSAQAPRPDVKSSSGIPAQPNPSYSTAARSTLSAEAKAPQTAPVVPPVIYVVNDSTVVAQAEKTRNAIREEAGKREDIMLAYMIGAFIGCTIIIVVFIYVTRSRAGAPKTDGLQAPSSSELNQWIEACNALRGAIASAARSTQSLPDNKNKATPSVDDLANKLRLKLSEDIEKLLSDSELRLLHNVSAHAVKALEKSEVVKLNAQIDEQARDLLAIRGAHEGLLGQISPLRESVGRAESERDEARRSIENLDQQNQRLSGQLTEALSSRDVFKVESEEERAKAERLLAENQASVRELEAVRAEIDNLKIQVAAGLESLAVTEGRLASSREEHLALVEKTRTAFISLAPSKLRGTELSSQIEVLYAEAIAGDATATFAWSTLSSFGASQSDPAAKDFQLQIVRRLGVVLTHYWKQKGLSEKERHERLSLWARNLNEHADGRYNLFVPGLGAPIDKTRMSCNSNNATVHEVLCWQIRNPAGANFMLAEVA